MPPAQLISDRCLTASCGSLAVKYFFMTNDGTNADAELVINPFNAVEEQNDYEVRSSPFLPQSWH